MSEATSQQPCATVFRLDQQTCDAFQRIRDEAMTVAEELGDDYEVVVRAELTPGTADGPQAMGLDGEVVSEPGIEALASQSNSGDAVEWEGERYLVVTPGETLEMPAEQFASLFGISG